MKMSAVDQDPVHVAEHFLEKTRQALMEADYEKFRSCFRLPYEYETFDTHTVVDDKEFQMLFERVVSAYKVNCVTALKRRCLSAHYRDEDTIHATYESKLMQGTVQINDTLVSYAVCKRERGEWRIVRDIYGIDMNQPHAEAFQDN